ncbi:Trehalose-6-phosphate synthase component TPS1 subunit, partial [Pseudoloma neurophilia]
VDYIKGIPERILAYGNFKNFKRQLNEKQPKSSQISVNLTEKEKETIKNRKTVFIQIGVPSRNNLKGYQFLNNRILEECAKVNESKTTDDLFNQFDKIHYLYNPISVSELIALYHLADMCIVSSVRDGMNLVAMEYIACYGELVPTISDDLKKKREKKRKLTDKIGEWINSSMESLEIKQQPQKKNPTNREKVKNSSPKGTNSNQSSKLDSKESDDQLDKIEIGNIKSLEAKREIDQTLER